MSGLDHPDVAAWLARLDSEAAALSEEQRVELRAGVEEYLVDAVQGSADGDTAAQRAVADLGDPADLVAEAGGYAVPPVEAPASPGESPAEDAGPPWLEVTTITMLAASVVLALIPATEALAPLPWLLGSVLVLLSRRWSAADKGLSLLAFGVLGVPLLLLGRDQLGTSASLLVSVLLAGLWLLTAVRLLLRARSPRDQGTGLRMR